MKNNSFWLCLYVTLLKAYYFCAKQIVQKKSGGWMDGWMGGWPKSRFKDFLQHVTKQSPLCGIGETSSH